jgi:putative transposase
MARSITLAPGEYYHVYNRGVDRRDVFVDPADYSRFLTTLYLANSGIPLHRSDFHYSEGDIFENERETSLVDIGAYALMPNHFHLLLHENSEGGISKFMQKLMTSYTMYFNGRNERTGPLFAGVFKAQHADTDTYLKYLYAYIHLNPLSIKYPKWRENKKHPDGEWKKFLTQYRYSSLPDYLELSKKRKQSVIINPAAFPKYFEHGDAVLNDLSEWVRYAQFVKVSP